MGDKRHGPQTRIDIGFGWLDRLAATTASTQNLVFMTGPAGGSWYPLGAAVQNILQEEIDGMSVNIRPGAGLINIRGVAEGKADLGWGNVISTVDAINGQPPFDKKMDTICNMGSFYTQYAQLITVAPEIKTWADLKGKRFATLPRGNTTEAAAQALLRAVGLTYDDLAQVNFASITDQVNMAKDGQVDAIFNITGVPAGGYLDLANSRETMLPPITDEQFEKLKAENSGWNRLIVKPDTYPHQPNEVPIAGFAMHMIANCETMPEETAYNIMKAISSRVSELGSVNRALANFTAKDLAADAGMPMHPGAKRFYEEAGAL